MSMTALVSFRPPGAESSPAPRFGGKAVQTLDDFQAQVGQLFATKKTQPSPAFNDVFQTYLAQIQTLTTENLEGDALEAGARQAVFGFYAGLVDAGLITISPPQRDTLLSAAADAKLAEALSQIQSARNTSPQAYRIKEE